MMDLLAEQFEFVRKAVEGDALALKLLLAGLHDDLSASVGRRIPPDLRSRVAADDVLQETYVQVFRNIANFQPRDANSFQHWVHTIAGNQLRNAIKSQRAVKRGGRAATGCVAAELERSYLSLLDLATGPGPTPSRTVARGEAALAVQDALDALPEQHRQALWLVYVEGRTAASAGQQLGRSERAIHGLCRRGLAMLRDRLGSADRLMSFKG